ncbi:hypothetical protein [Streptomyces sp. NPDC005507]|uniref:hypothetical protein n=1 Tax=Streptomyces sp. NPDC005507 TaxID=3154885 RepID=UPI0033B9287C
MDEDAKSYLAWAEGLSSEELDAEIALLEAHEARIAKDCADLAWQKRMFRGLLFCIAPARDGLTPAPS